VVRRYVQSRNLKNEETMTRVGSQRHSKKIKYIYITVCPSTFFISESTKHIDKIFMMLMHHKMSLINIWYVYISHNETDFKTRNSVLHSGVVIVPCAAIDVVRSRASNPDLFLSHRGGGVIGR